MPDGLKIAIGGLAVMALFGGYIWLFGLLSDRLRARAKDAEARNPGQAAAKAQLIVNRIGTFALQLVNTVVWVSGLLVLPAFFLIVYESAWMLAPVVFLVSIPILIIGNWSGQALEALKSDKLE